MITVWVLVAFIGSSTSGGPFVIDNIASKEECLRLGNQIIGQHHEVTGPLRPRGVRCYPVEKIK